MKRGRNTKPMGTSAMSVQYNTGFIVSDMAEEASPKLRYIPLPAFPYDPRYYTDELEPLSDSSSMGAAGPAAAVDEPVTWVKDDVVLDCEELWALPG
ncbi:hypothetical protein HU200_056221 [Digitaria exilis]|uniref:Uncharacterized protein n=1 Tax=Digitaria exilis TaxID=1010633 RepID=A0A835AGA3_9POAL|nr:hypothetical protein HU200_056221 [Digitaria exilis]